MASSPGRAGRRLGSMAPSPGRAVRRLGSMASSPGRPVRRLGSMAPSPGRAGSPLGVDGPIPGTSGVAAWGRWPHPRDERGRRLDSMAPSLGRAGSPPGVDGPIRGTGGSPLGSDGPVAGTSGVAAWGRWPHPRDGRGRRLGSMAPSPGRAVRRLGSIAPSLAGSTRARAVAGSRRHAATPSITRAAHLRVPQGDSPRRDARLPYPLPSPSQRCLALPSQRCQASSAPDWDRVGGRFSAAKSACGTPWNAWRALDVPSGWCEPARRVGTREQQPTQNQRLPPLPCDARSRM